MDLEPGGVWGQDCTISRGQVTKGLRDLGRGDLILMAMRRESLRVSFEESEVGVAFWKESPGCSTEIRSGSCQHEAGRSVSKPLP